jgi:hypothetical protein
MHMHMPAAAISDKTPGARSLKNLGIITKRLKGTSHNNNNIIQHLHALPYSLLGK